MQVSVLIFLCLVGGILCQTRTTSPTSGTAQLSPWTDLVPARKCEQFIRYKRGCYEDTVQLSCPTRTYPYIKTTWAFFGRDWMQELYCPGDTAVQPCGFDQSLHGHAKTVVQGICDGQSSCSIHVKSSNPFPEACQVNSRSYLKVRWQCCNKYAFRGCQKRVTKKYNVWVNPGCRSANPLFIGSCDGGCSSRQTMDFPWAFNGNTFSDNCKCCRKEKPPGTSSTYHHKVYCQWSGAHAHYYQAENIDSCGCQDCE